MLSKEYIDEFVHKTAAKEPVPGGGGVSALAGALGVALASMAANYTKGKKDFAKFDDEYSEIIEKNAAIADRLLKLIDEDAEGFLPLSAAFAMKAETDEEKAEKKAALQEGYRRALKAPLEIMDCCYEACLMLDELSNHTAPSMLSDIAVSVQMVRAALNGAYVNILVNVKDIDDKDYVGIIFEKIDYLMQNGLTICDTVFWAALNKL